MRLREWFQHPAQPPADRPADTPAHDADALRRTGADLLAAGDEAIRRALSRDSTEFLAANRQQGGQ